MKLSEKIQEALREQQEINLSDPAVQKRLAAQWGYVPAGAQPAPSIMDAIIDDLQSQFDSEGITEHDSGDALIRLSDAIAAVEDNFAGAQLEPSEQDVSVRKAWARFSHELHRSPDAPYPGMSEAFEQHFSQSFIDREWRAEAVTWAAAWKAAKRHGAQPAPSFADAYQGAMEEVAIWKKRALEAEDLNRKFVAEINGPTYMGEPAQPAPSVPREAIEKMLTQLMDIAVSNGANSISMPDEFVEVAAWLCGIPAQPAPSDWPMLHDGHLRALCFAYEKGFAAGVDERNTTNVFGATGSQAAAFDVGLECGRAAQSRAQPAPSAPSEEAAAEMGANGGHVVEAERLAFEAWMRGHCWKLGAKWTGTEYRSAFEKGGMVDMHAMRTRELWAAWRDRAALAAPKPETKP